MRGNSTAAHLGFTIAAAMPGLVYGARSVWALAERRVDHAAHATTAGPAWVVVGNLLLLALLAGAARHPVARAGARGLHVAIAGLAWVILTRTAEALQVPGPWGFYGAPGVLAMVGGLLGAGVSLRRSHSAPLGRLLTAVALLRVGGGAASMLLFNLLGRTDAANWTATVAGRSLHLTEAVAWVLVGTVLVGGRSAAAGSAATAGSRVGAIGP